MISVTFNYHLVTPAFLGGADQSAYELRPPALKGALRFWWRAKAWGRTLRDVGGNRFDALRELHGEEARLFGGVAEGQTGGQGLFSLRIDRGTTSLTPKQVSELIQKNSKSNVPLAYLLGQGLWHFSRGANRSALATDAVAVSAVFRPQATPKDIRSVAEAFWLLGTLGGIGARSRRGWGSLALQSISGCDGLTAPSSVGAISAGLASVLADRGSETHLPPFSAFSANSRIDCSANGSAALDVLAIGGRTMLSARSFYPEGMRGSGSRKAAAGSVADADHDAMYALVEEGDETVARVNFRMPHRAVYGLPHNYALSYRGQLKGRDLATVNIAPRGPDGKPGRRASPLIMHVHRFGDDSFALVQTLLPAEFLPLRPIHVAAKQGQNKQGNRYGNAHEFDTTVLIDDFQPILTYLDAFPSPAKLVAPLS